MGRVFVYELWVWEGDGAEGREGWEGADFEADERGVGGSEGAA